MAVDVSMTRKRSSASCESGQSTMTEGLGASAALSSAIADMILKKGLSHTLSEDPLMARVLKFAKVAPASYKPPTREDIGGRYLDTFSIRYEKKNDALVVEVSKKFGWSMMSDGATVLHIPLVNVLAGGAHRPRRRRAQLAETQACLGQQAPFTRVGKGGEGGAHLRR